MELCIWPWASGAHEGVESVEDNRQASLLSRDESTLEKRGTRGTDSGCWVGV